MQAFQALCQPFVPAAAPPEGESVVTTVHPSSELPVFAEARFQTLPGRQG